MASVQVFAIVTIPIYSQANSAYHSQDVCDIPQSNTLEKAEQPPLPTTAGQGKSVMSKEPSVTYQDHTASQ